MGRLSFSPPNVPLIPDPRQGFSLRASEVSDFLRAVPPGKGIGLGVLAEALDLNPKATHAIWRKVRARGSLLDDAG